MADPRPLASDRNKREKIRESYPFPVAKTLTWFQTLLTKSNVFATKEMGRNRISSQMIIVALFL